MALVALSDDALGVVFEGLRNTLDPRVLLAPSSASKGLRAPMLALSSASHGLRAPMQALLQQLRADYEVAAGMCRKAGLRSCKELREAKEVSWRNKGLSTADWAMLGTLGSVLPALERLRLGGGAAGPHGMQRLAAGLGAGALPALTWLVIDGVRVSDTGASALAAALGRGAMPRLEILGLICCFIGDAGLVALAPALRRLPELQELTFSGNPFGDEGLAALVAPPPLPAGALSPTAGVLTKLKMLTLHSTQVNDAGCAALASSLRLYHGGIPMLPALEHLYLTCIPASDAADDDVFEALSDRRRAQAEARWRQEAEAR
eukprot:scaffold14182_cov65-Phaeocystis_antarctica.AAC.1